MSLFYTTPDHVLCHPLNRPWGEIQAMSDAVFAQWWADTARLLVQQYEKFDTPPKNALSEDALLAEFRRLCTIDPSTQIVRDYTDNTTAYLNSTRVSVADQFFKNIFEAKDRVGNRWLSVLDNLRKPDEFVSAITRVLKRDGKYEFAPTVRRGTESLEDYITANKEHNGFLFYKPDNHRKKPLHGKHFTQVGVVRRLIAQGLLPDSVGDDLKTLEATEKVFLREYRKDERVFPKLFKILQTTLISAPTNFPSVVARSIYSRYALPHTPGTEVTIWDPSMGFGGRLLGALSLLDRPIHYIGTDPNSLNYFPDGSSRYSNLEDVFKSEVMRRRDTFRGTYLQCGSEDAHTRSEFQAYRGKLDLVMTSPPYFSAELYSDEPTQSSLKFATYEDWREHFLARTMQTGAEWLRKGGYLILNVANSGRHPIEDDARIIARQLKLKLFATEKMLLAHSSGAGRKQNGQPTTWNFTSIHGKQVKMEPVYVFAKEHDTPTISKFHFTSLHQPKTKISRKAQTGSAPISTTPLPKTVSLSSKKEWDTIRTLYRSFDKKCHNPFGKIKHQDNIVRITDGRHVVAAYVVNQRNTKGEECLYRGEKRSVPIVHYEKGDLEISKLAAFAHTPDAQAAIVSALKQVSRPCAVEVFADDTFQGRCLTQAGFVCLGSSINSQSDVFHIYLDADHADSRRCVINPAEHTNIKELPIRGLLPLVKRLEQRLDEIKSYESHPSSYNKNETWGALALRGYLPDPHYIESLEEHASYQKALNEEWLKKYPKQRQGLQDTTLMNQFPEVREILEKICPGSLKNDNAQFKRVRLMSLAPTEGELLRHTDLTDGTLGIEDGKTVRLHVPLRTNPKVFVTSWDTNDQEHRIHMKLGSLWYLNIRLPHKVINQGDTERVHLVIDCVANERIRELIGGELGELNHAQDKKNGACDKSAA